MQSKLAGPVAVAGRQPVGVELEGAAGGAAREQVAGHGERSLHDAGDVGVLGRREVLHAGDVNCGAALDHGTVGEVGVAELREGVVADVEHPGGDVLVAGDREVPGEVEVLALDAGAFCSVLKMLSKWSRRALITAASGGQLVAVVAEAVRGRDRPGRRRSAGRAGRRCSGAWRRS